MPLRDSRKPHIAFCESKGYILPMWRRSLSCMAAGILIVGPLIVAGESLDWRPHAYVVIAMVTICVAGIMWLTDEISGV